MPLYYSSEEENRSFTGYLSIQNRYISLEIFQNTFESNWKAKKMGKRCSGGLCTADDGEGHQTRTFFLKQSKNSGPRWNSIFPSQLHVAQCNHSPPLIFPFTTSLAKSEISFKSSQIWFEIFHSGATKTGKDGVNAEFPVLIFP